MNPLQPAKEAFDFPGKCPHRIPGLHDPENSLFKCSWAYRKHQKNFRIVARQKAPRAKTFVENRQKEAMDVLKAVPGE